MLINEIESGAIIIAGSGMCNGGRILHHLKNHIEDPRNTILIVSWQAPHTLGRRLADQETNIRIFGKRYKRRAEVVTINGFSAHADQEGLVAYARATQDTLKKVFLVHGEPTALDALRVKLEYEFNWDPVIPQLNEEFVMEL